MNMKAIFLGVKLAGRHALNFCKRHAPQIMVAAGVAGFAGTAVASGKAALKARDILDERDETLKQIEEQHLENDGNYTEKDYADDQKIVKTQTAWKLVKTFAPPVTLGAASAALIFGGHHIMGRRAAAALASAYEAQKKLYAYDTNVVEQLGEETAEKLRKGLAIDKLKTSEELKKKSEEPEKENKKAEKAEGRAVSFPFNKDTCNPVYGVGCGWSSNPYKNWMKIRATYNEACERLRIYGHLTINEILWSYFGHPAVMGGNDGWICDPRGLGTDEMKWTVISTENGKEWPIEDFVLNCTYDEIDRECLTDYDIRFTAARNSETLDVMVHEINKRKGNALGGQYVKFGKKTVR